MALSLFNVAFALAALNNNRNISSNAKLADSVVAGLLPDGLGLAFPLVVNAQQPTAPQQSGSAQQNLALVPNVVGEDPTTAGTTLKQVQLTSTTQVVAVADPTIKPNTVVQQDPQSNEIVPVGSNVSLFASPPPSQAASAGAAAPAIGASDVQQLTALPQKLKDAMAEAHAQSQALELKLEGSLAEAVGKKVSEGERKVLAETERMLGKQEEKLLAAFAKRVSENEPKLLEKIEHLLERKIPKRP